jgi:hypothetical protein
VVLVQGEVTLSEENPMKPLRPFLFAAPLALLVACGGDSSTGSAFTDAAPDYSALSIDQYSSDVSTSSVQAAETATSAAALTASSDPQCHPHLFLRTREVVGRINLHIYKALRHVEALLARKPVDATDTTRVWDRIDGGVERKLTIALVSPDVYSWELDVGPAGAVPLPVVMTGQIDRSGATGPFQGKGSFHVDFAKLHAAYPLTERASQGTLDVTFDSQAASRALTVVATDVAWDPSADALDTTAAKAALAVPRSGSYVYLREYGKGGSLKIHDQMVFECPANPESLLGDVQLVSRWYVASAGVVHGRSDALMTGGQLTADVPKVVGVTCHEGSADGLADAESFWLMKAEKVDGSTSVGWSTQASDGTTPCDATFGPVPTLDGSADDFTAWPSSYGDGTPFPFPGM